MVINADEKIGASTEFAPNYDFVKSRVLTVEDFYGTLFVEFAKYRANQRIPRLDGLNETQRKIIWNAMLKGYTKKIKLMQFMSETNLNANYHHGDASLAGALNNVIAPYKNNLRVLQPDGSFGSRTVRKAAAWRYTETRIYDYLKLLFPMEDIVATKAHRVVDGKPAEPLTLLPIIPMGIINGQNQAAVGFSTNLLPRDPFVIIDLLINILTGKVNTIPGAIPPTFPFFKGTTTLIDKNKWEMKGAIQKEKRGKTPIIRVTEVPPSWSKITLVKAFDKLVEKGIIDSYVEGCKGNTFDVEVVAPKLQDLSEDKIIEKLGISETETERFIYIASEEVLDQDGNETGKTKDKFEIECTSIAQYINYFIKRRLKVYEERKKYRQAKQLWEIKRLIAMINYINEVNAGRIEIRNMEEEQILEQLKKYPPEYQFEPMTEKFVWDPIEVKLARVNFNYLFDFKTRNFQPKALAKLNENYQELYKAYQDMTQVTGASLWLQDLITFKEVYTKFLKSEEAKMAAALKNKKSE